MNKNNKSSDNHTQNENTNSKSKNLEGKSQFIRGKLQRDYEPKLKKFKHKLLKTSEYQKLVLQRIQNGQDEQKVTSSALQCFKKGQIIDLDWKTKSNFRKSDIGLRFPRINTQPLSQMLENQLKNKSNRTNTLQPRYSKSFKQKSIENKCMKLKQLLGLQAGENRSFFKSSKSSQINQSKENFTKSIFFQQQDKKLPYSKEKNDLQSNTILSSPVAGLSVNLSQFLSKQKSINQSESDFNFQNLRSQTQQLQNVRAFQLSENKSERKNHQKSYLQSVSSHQQALHSQKNQNNQSQKDNDKKATISTEQQKNKNFEGYDILHDPNIYMLIERTRQRIINFKESISLKNMSKLQRIKFLQQKKIQNEISEQKVRSKSLSLSKHLKFSKISKNDMIQKIEQKKKSISEKINKDVSRVFTQIQQYVKNAQIQESKHYSQIYSYLNLKNDDDTSQKKIKTVFQGRQGKIKNRKRKSLVEVQQKLLKQVKLSFLKEDLTNKFQQIRNYHHLSISSE